MRLSVFLLGDSSAIEPPSCSASVCHPARGGPASVVAAAEIVASFGDDGDGTAQKKMDCTQSNSVFTLFVDVISDHVDYH